MHSDAEIQGFESTIVKTHAFRLHFRMTCSTVVMLFVQFACYCCSDVKSYLSFDTILIINGISVVIPVGSVVVVVVV